MLGHFVCMSYRTQIWNLLFAFEISLKSSSTEEFGGLVYNTFLLKNKLKNFMRYSQKSPNVDF